MFAKVVVKMPKTVIFNGSKLGIFRIIPPALFLSLLLMPPLTAPHPLSPAIPLKPRPRHPSSHTLLVNIKKDINSTIAYFCDAILPGVEQLYDTQFHIQEDFRDNHLLDPLRKYLEYDDNHPRLGKSKKIQRLLQTFYKGLLNMNHTMFVKLVATQVLSDSASFSNDDRQGIFNETATRLRLVIDSVEVAMTSLNIPLPELKFKQNYPIKTIDRTTADASDIKIIKEFIHFLRRWQIVIRRKSAEFASEDKQKPGEGKKLVDEKMKRKFRNRQRGQNLRHRKNKHRRMRHQRPLSAHKN